MCGGAQVLGHRFLALDSSFILAHHDLPLALVVQDQIEAPPSQLASASIVSSARKTVTLFG
jgi:hypothetical protein